MGGEYKFFNYNTPKDFSSTLGQIPVVTLHGTHSALSDGFVFDNEEYGFVSAKNLEWHNDLAARISTGNVLVIGSNLDESDLETYLALRKVAYPRLKRAAKNWLVTPNPDPVKLDNLEAAGFEVIDCTGEDFFNALYARQEPCSIGEIAIRSIPTAQKKIRDIKAHTWFKETFSGIPILLENAKEETGIVRHYMMGDEPEWYYIANDVPARTHRDIDLTAAVGALLQSSQTGVRVLHIVGPSGSGKTTSIKNALRDLTANYPYCYEFCGINGIEPDALKSVVSAFTSKSVIVFYSAYEFYFAIKHVRDSLDNEYQPLCVFLLEDRSHDFQKNKHHLFGGKVPTDPFMMSNINLEDAISIASKIEDAGIRIPDFSELSITRRASILSGKERGYDGDLLSAMFSLTQHENFETKLHQDYVTTKGAARDALNLAALYHSLGHIVPLEYISTPLSVSPSKLLELLDKDLNGILVISRDGRVRCRHRRVAEHYVKNYVFGNKSEDEIIAVLEFLSTQFSVEDIGLHPLPYRIYKDIINHKFLHSRYFESSVATEKTHAVYNVVQHFFASDGLFWLQFGRFFRHIGDIDSAISCFRSGLNLYESYQAEHSLGVALIDKFVEDECQDVDLYEEGFALLEKQVTKRGRTDPYPATGIVSSLLKIRSASKNVPLASERLQKYINFGVKYFPGETFFTDAMKKALK